MGSIKILNAKKEVVNEIVENASGSAAVIFFDNNGVTDNEFKNLRNELRNNDSTLKVYKNTLTRLALKEMNIDIDDSELTGPKTIIFSNNIVEPAKIIKDFAKSNKNVEIKFGIIDGRITSNAELMKLANIPSRDGLLTMLASSMLGVQKNLAISLNLLKDQKEQ